MLRIQIESTELFDEARSEFISVPGAVLVLEHSLLSLSKWESKFQKPFLGTDDKTSEELLGYVEAMCAEPLEDPASLQGLTARDYEAIRAYLESTQSATTFGEMPDRPGGPKERITSELIYYWMVAFNIPWEAERWHLNRLFALIRICNIKNQQASGKKRHSKVSPAEAARQRAALNAQRRAELGTTG